MKKLLLVLAGTVLLALLTVPSAVPDTGSGTDGIVLTPDPLAPGPAAPMNAQCNGTLIGMTVHDVTIPPHGSCTIFNSHVTGNITGQADSTLDATDVTVDGNLTMQKANSLRLRLLHGNRVGHDLTVNGLTVFGRICDTFVGGNLTVTQLATSASIAVGDTSCVSGTSRSSDTVVGDVRLDNNAGFVIAQFLGGGAAPAGFTPCTDQYGAAFAGHDLSVTGNTGGVELASTNICHDLTVSGNSGHNVVGANTAGHDATCSNNSPFVGGNVAAHDNNGCA
jgi:hypothetical protein